MYTIRAIIHCSGKYTEVLPESLASLEPLIEECFSLLLLELFEVVQVDVVTVDYIPPQDSCGTGLHPAA